MKNEIAVLDHPQSAENSRPQVVQPTVVQPTVVQPTVVQTAIVGMGGFARNHHQAMRTLENAGEVALQATCDPQPEQFAAEQGKWNLPERGVAIYSDYLAMLDEHRNELDFVCIPTPIPLHAPMHRACVERGLACYLEKPPTLSWRELNEMLEVERRARLSTQVGFNFIAETPRQALKERLLAGEFGPLRRAGFAGYWPRSANYFRRAAWAGKLMMGEQLVLDSCVGNAMAHYIHNLLFWCGRGEVLAWGEVPEVEAELYRAHAIESFDTCFVRGRCGGDVEILVAATHAGSGAAWEYEWLECEQATITYLTRREYSIRWRDGCEERGEADRRELLVENLRQYARYVGGREERPLTRLIDSRPFVHFQNLLFLASGKIATVPETFLHHTPSTDPLSLDEWLTIEDIEEVMKSFTRDRRLPSERGLAWAKQGGRAQTRDLEKLESVVRRMQADYPAYSGRASGGAGG